MNAPVAVHYAVLYGLASRVAPKARPDVAISHDIERWACDGSRAVLESGFVAASRAATSRSKPMVVVVAALIYESTA